MNWVKTESTNYPETVDISSSPTTVYINRNINEVEKDGVTMYEYETCKMTHEQFQVYVAAEQYKKISGGNPE